MSKITRIAMISEHGDPLAPLGGRQAGGQNVYVYEVAKAISKMGIKVDVFSRWENRKASQIVRFAKRAKVIRLKAGPRHFIAKEKFGLLMPEFVEHFLEYVRSSKVKYDLIYTHYYYSGWVGMQLKYILKVPLIHTFHSLGIPKKIAMGDKDPSPDERTKIETQLMEKSDLIISTSPQEKLNMIQNYGARGNNIVVIPAGVNVRRFFPLDKKIARKKLSLLNDKHIIVFAGRMEEKKGGITVIEATSIIKRKWPNLYNNLLVYMFTGDTRKRQTREKSEKEIRHSLKDTLKRLKVGDKVILMQGIEQEKLHYYYGAADLVVMPSYYEPFGMVAVEAMASGTPVVASNVGGLKWIVEDGITGFHAEPKDAKGFAKQMVKILSNPDLEERMSQNSIIRAQNNFSWPLIADSMVDNFKNVIEKEKSKEK